MGGQSQVCYECHLAKDEIVKESLSGGDEPGAVGEIPLPDPVSQAVTPQGLHIHSCNDKFSFTLVYPLYQWLATPAIVVILIESGLDLFKCVKRILGYWTQSELVFLENISQNFLENNRSLFSRKF